jgi:predicted Zn-dependent protease
MLYFNRNILKTLLLTAALTGFYGCATNPVTGKSDVVLMSEQQEISTGKKGHQQVIQQYGIYKNAELDAMLQRIGQQLAVKSHRSQLQYHFTLLDSADVNAFALPGGYIYVTRGIIAYMNSEEELAGVLGHELGHVTARHGVRQQSSSMLLGVLGAVAAATTGVKAVGDLSNMLGGALIRGYGRKHELEADRLGAEYLARVGYDPQKMLDVVGILKDQEAFAKQKASDAGKAPTNYHGVFSTHPRNDQRLQEVIQAAEKYRVQSPRRTDPDAFVKLLSGMTFGESEGQGITRKNKFYHKGLDFGVTFPDNWRIQNEPTRIVAMSPKKDAIMMVTLGKAPDSTPAVQYLQKKHGQISEGQSLSAKSYAGVAKAKTPFNTNTARVAAVLRGDQAFDLIAAGKQPVNAKLFYDTVNSVRSLNDKERALASEMKIKAIRARRGDTFSKLAAASNWGKYAEEQLRVLNGRYPDGEPKSGEWIKVIEQ